MTVLVIHVRRRPDPSTNTGEWTISSNRSLTGGTRNRSLLPERTSPVGQFCLTGCVCRTGRVLPDIFPFMPSIGGNRGRSAGVPPSVPRQEDRRKPPSCGPDQVGYCSGHGLAPASLPALRPPLRPPLRPALQPRVQPVR